MGRTGSSPLATAIVNIYNSNPKIPPFLEQLLVPIPRIQITIVRGAHFRYNLQLVWALKFKAIDRHEERSK